MIVNIYINEESLVGQYCKDVEGGVLQLMSAAKAIQSYQSVDVKMYYTKAIFGKQICTTNGYTLIQMKSASPTLFQALMQMLNKASDWKLSPLQDGGSTYTSMGQSANDTSMAEAYERSHQPKEATLLLNFGQSVYGEPTTEVCKNGNNVAVNSLVSTENAAQFIESLGIYPAFDPTGNEKVQDEQTILVDEELFVPTVYYNHHRKVYKRIGKEEYWCADNQHRDGSVHLEVFSKTTGKFKGTCAIDDVMKFTEKKENRYIDLQRRS